MPSDGVLSSATRGQSRLIVAGFVRYLGEEGLIGLTGEEMESVEIALQCLESVFSTSSVPVDTIPDIRTCLSACQSKNKETNVVGGEDVVRRAEELKVEGNRHLAAGRHEDARHCYEQAIELDPENAVYHSNLAAVLTALGDYEAAVDSSQRAVDLDPGYVKAWSRLGTALRHSGRREESIEAFEEVLRLDPGNEQARSALTQLQAQKKPQQQSPSLADMMGGMDINKIMSDPNFMQMANQMMQSGAFADMLKDPSGLQDMMKKMRKP